MRHSIIYGINVEQIASIFTELLEELKENDLNKNNSIKNNKEEKRNSILKLKRKNTLDKKTSNKSVKFQDKPTTKIIKSLKTINGNIKLGLNETNKNENQKRITKFKLILPIAKGGYGVVGLYKNVKTNDIYAIKTVDIKSMKEKHLSNTLKNERILWKINKYKQKIKTETINSFGFHNVEIELYKDIKGIVRVEVRKA